MLLLPSRVAVQALLLSTPLQPRTDVRLEITVCTGGICGENGADLLLDACSVLAAGDAAIEVKTAFCSGECPVGAAMLCPSRGSLEAYEATCGTVEEAVASAQGAIAAAEATILPGLKEAFLLGVEARAAEAAGSDADLRLACERYAAAIAAAPASLLEPCHEPLEPEPLAWEGSCWKESLFSSELAFSEALEASCGGGTALVDKKVVSMPTLTLRGEGEAGEDGREAARMLAGRWEDTEGGRGRFELTMGAAGLTFDGVFTTDAEGGETAAWHGVRKAAKPAPGQRVQRRRGARPRVNRDETPPSRVKWLHEAWLAKGRCHTTLGETAAAVDAARAATRLCCRTASGWVALAEAVEAHGGDPDEASGARAQAEYLKVRL